MSSKAKTDSMLHTVNQTSSFRIPEGLLDTHIQSIDGVSTFYGLTEIRRLALRRLRELPFISSKQELWRQTKPDLFPFATLTDAVPVELQISNAKDNKVTICHDLAKCKEAVSGVLCDSSGSLVGDALEALQLSVVSGGGVVRVADGISVADPIHLSQTVVGSPLSAAPLIVVVVGRGAKCSIIEDLGFNSSLFYFPRVEVVLGEGAEVSFTSIQRMGREAIFLGRHRFLMGRDAKLKTFHAFLGATVSRLDLDCRFLGAGAFAELNALYITSGSRHVDYHALQEHLVPHCSSNLLCKGALKGASRGVYYGLIKVAEGADGTDAYQKNRNLLLSPDARVDTVPNLEIRANDVKCSHGASVGQVGAEEMFYLMTRGLDKEKAERLLVEGFFEELLVKIESDSLREQVRNTVLEYLND